MTITLPDIEFLVSPMGETLLQQLVAEDLSQNNTLSLLTKFRKYHAPEQAAAALEMARLRLKAVDKFGETAKRLFFTREALEQASDPLVRRYRAERIMELLSQTAYSHAQAVVRITDVCCGIGADSLAFAQKGAAVLGLDIDPVRVEIARYNAAAMGVDARFSVADVREGLLPADVMFFDPARRDEQGKRIHNVEQYQPPLSIIRDWQAALIAVKLSPGVELQQLDVYEGGVEFVSVDGDLKEAILWIGAGWKGSRATLLTQKAVYHWGEAQDSPDAAFSKPRAWLIEPDASLLRAGLVQNAAAVFEGHMLDETIAYFTCDNRPESPWVRAWKILDWMPFHVKKLRAYLREHDVGNVTVKKRGSAVTPEVLIPQLKLQGIETRVLVLTRLQGQPIVLVCAEYQP